MSTRRAKSHPSAPPDAGHPISVGLVSLGCAKNLVDSQIMAGVLISDAIRLAPSPEEADVIIVNTCAFIEPARRESMAVIRDVCAQKAQGKCRAVVVTGCLPQRYRTALRAELPDVDAFLGLDELETISAVVRRLGRDPAGTVAVSARPNALYEPRIPGLVFSSGRYAYVKIAEGCNHPCAFCAIPAIRGRHRSRPLRRVLAEAEKLLEAGMRELILIGQDVTAYGQDLGRQVTLPALLRALGGLGGKFWIRLLYAFPTRVTDELLDTMAEIPQVCHYLDVPIQHSHPDVLRAMRRGQTTRHVHALARRVRVAMPDVALRTTCLVGYPGETEARFRHLLQFVRDTGFDHLGVFAFSPEEGTAARALPGRPPPEVADRRRVRLMRAQRQIVDRKATALLGTTAEVLLDRPLADEDGVLWVARSARHAPEVDGQVFVAQAPAKARAGDFLRVRYTAQADYDLLADARAATTPR